MLHVVPASTTTLTSSPGRAKAAEISPPPDSANVDVLLRAEATLDCFAASTNETMRRDLPLIRLGQQFILLAIVETRADQVATHLDADTTAQFGDDDAWRAAMARAEEAAEHTLPLANAIFRTPARGLAGLFVKAVVARKCNGGSFMAECAADCSADNNAVAGSIVDDLMDMVSGPSSQTAQATAGGDGISSDPTFAAIERHRKTEKDLDVLFAQIDEIEHAAFDSDPYPSALVIWRNYGAICGAEIEQARDEFLAAPHANRAQIAREYRQKKAEFRTLQMAQRSWDKKHGAIDLRQRAEACGRKCVAAEQLLERCEPTTISGAAALAEYAHADLKIGGKKWPMAALRMAVEALKRLAPSPCLAAMAAPPAVASADAADPIFAAIEKHRVAYTAYLRQADVAEAIEQSWPAGSPANLSEQNRLGAIWRNESGFGAADKETDRLYDIAFHLLDELDKTAPITPAGVHAYMYYRLNHERLGDEVIEQHPTWLLLRNAERALARVLAG